MPIPWLAIAAAAVAAWIFGAVWFGLLGRPWAVGLGLMPVDPAAPRGSPPVFALVVSLIAEFVMAVILDGLLTQLAGPQFGMEPALLGAFFVWLGFVAPAIATNYAYQRRPWPVYAVDLGHWLGVLLIEGVVLSLLA